MKKILIFTHEFPPFLGGVGKIGYDLAKLHSKEDDVIVMTRSEKEIKKLEGVRFQIIKTIPKLWFLNYGWFYLNNKKIFDESDLIYLNEAAPTVVAGMFFKKKHIEKSVIIAHGLEVENLLLSENGWHKFFKLKSNYIRALECCKKLLTLSNAMKEKLSSVLEEYEHKIEYCYLGVDVKTFYFNPNVFQIEEYKSYKNNYVIGSCSRLIVKKGYLKMADIVKQVIDKRPDTIWLIAGDGEDSETIKSYVKDIGIQGNTVFLGALTFEKLRDFYSSLDVFMLLSDYDEVFPLVYIEAQLCGAKAVGRNKGGTREVIDASTGLLVDNEEQVIEFLLSRKEYSRDIIINNSQKFDIENSFESWRKFLEI